MASEKLFAVTIRVAAVKEICVEAKDVGDAEKLAHGLFAVEDCDPRTLVQETVGVQCCGSAAVRKKSKPWVIVENPGTDMERSVDDFLVQLGNAIPILRFSVSGDHQRQRRGNMRGRHAGAGHGLVTVVEER